ncbi:alpha/beta fold hydrolase [Trinickia terrae]|uniref:Alpha/beta fold hydrolase n=1 Tax=Trinickia terrae TaxID=2571161 RepID=A0A4U1I1B8_9BURK|nr:alpha/beta fold hydrolase [Trinickia terrae]TKC86905.1 alpha/beta fold hydrolase [Trinickia terrae]
MSSLKRVFETQSRGPFSIIFIHGLGGHFEKTWMSRSKDHTSLWPSWVGEDSGCETWVLDYDADLSGWRDSAMPLPAQGLSFLDCLDGAQDLENRPLILVGHSMGGLVIKTAIVHAMTRGVKRYQALARRIRGVVFLATPHQGSDLATLADTFKPVLRTNAQVGDMNAHNEHLLALSDQFLLQLNELKFKVRAFSETKGVEIGKRLFGLLAGQRVMVVKRGNGNPHVPGESLIPIAADHFSICKPARRKGEQVHNSLLAFIRECGKAEAEQSAEAAPTRLTGSTEPTVPITLPVTPDQSLLIAEVLKTPLPDPAPGAPGRLSGSKDSRLRPREGVILGRDAEIAKVLAFLRSSDDSAVVCAQVTGFGGIGKTEVCKAALKAWLEGSPAETVFYVDVPDETSPEELPSLIGRALGADEITSFDQLTPILKPGLYYLDNLESVAEKAEGVELLRKLQQRNGVRLLASSRVDLAGATSQPIRIDVLPLEAAIQLFRKLWVPNVPLPADALEQFVLKDLGCHALSVTLMARLGHSYSFDEIVSRWKDVGVAFAKDLAADSRLDSLPISLRLTRDALAAQPGALQLWTLAALFPEGIETTLVTQFQQTAGWPDEARQALSRHHVWELRGKRFHLLPPVARFALDEAATSSREDIWLEVRPVAFDFFLELAKAVGEIASTDESLRARAQLLDTFDALHRLIFLELHRETPEVETIERLVLRLANQFQFRPVLSVEILRACWPHMKDPSRAFVSLGGLEERLGRPDEARKLYSRALELFELQQDELGQANTLLPLGNLERRLGRPDQARALYNRALALFERKHSPLGLANTLQSLGYLEARAGHRNEARTLYDRALTIFESKQVGLGQATTLRFIGNLEMQLGRFDEALEQYSRALSLFEQEHSRLGIANTLRSMGDLLSRVGKLDEARELYNRVLPMYEPQQDRLGLANTFHALGELERRQGRLDEARELYSRALSLYERRQIGLGLGKTLQALGDLEHKMGRTDEARALYEQALPIFKGHQAVVSEANTLSALGNLRRKAGAHDDALNLYREALQLYAQVDQSRGKVFTYADIARSHHALGQADARDDALKQAWSDAQALKSEGVVKYVLKALREITGSADAAIAWLEEALDKPEGDGATGT